jgi:carbon storage regulator
VLVLHRRVGERIQIGDNVWLVVQRIKSGRVLLGFEAPKEIKILREEVADDGGDSEND